MQHPAFSARYRKRNSAGKPKDVFNPAAVVKDDRVYLLYRAEDHEGKYAGTSRVGTGSQRRRAAFYRRMPEPVLYPEKDEFSVYEWEGGL